MKLCMVMRFVEETLTKAPRSVVTNSGKRAPDGTLSRPPKRGHDSHSSGKGARCGSQLSQSRQQSRTVVIASGLMGGS
ncbi:hypothetical protein PVK06_020480 [Gossypium arboreum]|uniref:Uncharacterized protein n=1 Tax=Gossypium arboreum TaxID=29729 RepID=A0ABR0PMZ9_GOSAR|nr:hypothetical protein PVK06_020480 [Gossypium arboreum]